MKKYQNHLVLILFALTGAMFELHAQSNAMTDTIVWTASPYIDTREDSSVFENYSKFITYGDKKIKWIQYSKPDANQRTKPRSVVMDVTNTRGSWPDINTDGQIAYAVLIRENAGVLRIKRSGPSCVVHLEWTNNRGRKNSYDFEVSNHHPLNRSL